MLWITQHPFFLLPLPLLPYPFYSLLVEAQIIHTVVYTVKYTSINKHLMSRLNYRTIPIPLKPTEPLLCPINYYNSHIYDHTALKFHVNKTTHILSCLVAITHLCLLYRLICITEAGSFHCCIVSSPFTIQTHHILFILSILINPLKSFGE